jgi:2-iminoacetate synthase ThiH
MGAVFARAIEAAGLSECQAEALAGTGLSQAQIERLRRADLLLVAALADQVRARFRGDEVRIVTRSRLSETRLAVFEAVAAEDGPTGADVLREIALLRLATPAAESVAVSIDGLGLELAQTALLFGADVLFGDLAGKRTLPLLDGPAARRRELQGLVERSGRRVHFADESAAQPQEQQP